MSIGWSWYVIALVAFNIFGCAWLLWWTARRKPGDPAPTDTSHIWDGDITEYNKPLPRWWINLFYITIAFSLGYLFWYGGWGSYPGMGKWTSKGEHARVKAAEDAKLNETFALYKDQSIPALARDPAALALGRSIFNNTCATCHGSSAQGAIGYPNLSDNIWHWGGSPERVLETVLDGREGVMPEWGKVLTGIGGPNAVDYVVGYVQTLSHPERLQNNYLAAQGRPLYNSVCVACHGDRGQGNPELGAPSLADDYWLYGDSKQALTASITYGRHGIMPPHRELLGPTRSRLVAAYVWSLSNRNKAPVGNPNRATTSP
jgi:cytochrome c oxidase cbb3-type subunit 3